MNVTGHHYQHRALIAWVTLPNGTPTAWTFHHGSPDTPGVTAALDGLAAAVTDAVMLEMMRALPDVPDTPPATPLVKPCRICDAVTLENRDDVRGFTFCPQHRPTS